MPTVAELYKLDLPMWQEQSACAGMDPELWVGDDHSNTRVAKAKAICATCPVLDTCLDWALQLDKTLGNFPGIYGGLTSEERRKHKICRYVPCNEKIKKINTKPRAQNNFCSEEHQKLQAKLVVSRANAKNYEQPVEYYMRGSIRNGKGSAGTY